jgi:hypothetical protein
MNDRRFPAALAHRLDGLERLVWLPPAEVIGALALWPDEATADLLEKQP